MTADGPDEFEVVDVLEEVFVIDLKLAFLQIFLGDPYILVVVAHLVGMGIEATIGGDNTIAVEVVVAGRIASVVATIGKDFLASHLALVAQALVYEVPDEAALILGILAYQVPVLLETTHRVAHGMSILTLDKWTGIVALGIFLTVAIVEVHGAEDVCLAVLSGLLVLYGTSGVNALDPVVDGLEVRAVTSLVTHAPDDDAGMVAQGEHIALVALQVHQLEVLTLGKRLLTIAHAMALEVGLCHEIQACRVAELIPAGIVRIVRGAHSIDVQLLHDTDVLTHTLHGDDIASIGIEFMTVHTFY